MTLIDPLHDLLHIGRLASTVHIVRGDFLRRNEAIVGRYLQAVARSLRLVKSASKTAKEAFYAFLARQSRGAELAPRIADRAWKDVLPAFSDTLETSREQYENAQKFFKIPPAVTYELFARACGGQLTPPAFSGTWAFASGTFAARAATPFARNFAGSRHAARPNGSSARGCVRRGRGKAHRRQGHHCQCAVADDPVRSQLLAQRLRSHGIARAVRPRVTLCP